MTPAAPGGRPLEQPRPVPDLAALLPMVHQVEDHREGGPLRALLEVLSAQGDIVRRDVEGLWDDLFIETCRDWVVPYLGDLVGTRPLHDVGHARRRDVAKTLHYRRRKGVLPMLEGLAQDVTGWTATGVAEFERLAWSQHLAHLRTEGGPRAPSARFDPALSRVAAAEVRDPELMDLVGRPADATCRTVDVRHSPSGKARPHVRNVTFHARPHLALGMRRTRLHAVTLPQGHPHRGKAYFIGHLKADFPLFGPDGPLRPLAVHRDLEAARRRAATGKGEESRFFGLGRPLRFVAGGVDIPPQNIFAMDLGDGSDWGTRPKPVGPGRESAVPWVLQYEDRHGHALQEPGVQDAWRFPIRLVVDVERGRVLYTGPVGNATGAWDPVVDYRRGQAAPLGGGRYPRRLAETLDRPWAIHVPADQDNLVDALAAWDAAKLEPGGAQATRAALVEITRDYAFVGQATLHLPPEGDVVVRAGSGSFPHLLAKVTVRGPPTGQDLPRARLTLDGLCIRAKLHVHGQVDLTLRHCTLVPGVRLGLDGAPALPAEPSIVLEPGSDVRLVLDHSVVGPLRVPAGARDVHARDSILQAPPRPGGRPAVAYAEAAPDAGAATPGAPLRLERCTVFGAVHARTLEASETLFTAPVAVERRQEGCVRFSHVPHGSATPRRFRCQPDLAVERLGPGATPQDAAIARARVAPVFLSRRYGHPDFARLRPDTDPGVREGAEDGGEMGAHHLLRDPHREQNLAARMEEYLPIGRRHTLDIHEARP